MEAAARPCWLGKRLRTGAAATELATSSNYDNHRAEKGENRRAVRELIANSWVCANAARLAKPRRRPADQGDNEQVPNWEGCNHVTILSSCCEGWVASLVGKEMQSKRQRMWLC